MTDQTHDRMLSSFEKNRFFKGKLMTPRDMTVEQQYHADRLHTLARFVLGSGIVAGLDVKSVAESDDKLAVTIQPGVAIDGYGRPIQVDRRTSTTLPPPEAETISLYVRHSEQPAESVPVPDEVGGASEGSAVNRAVESFEVTYRPGPPTERTGFDGVDLDAVEGADPATVAREITSQYHERHRTELSVPGDPAVFLGTFERTADGNWAATDAGVRRYAVDQELLLATLAEHLADGHAEPSTHDGTSAEQDRLAERLDRLESSVADLERDRDAFARYAVRRTLGDRARAFETLAVRIEPRSGAASRLAREVAATDRDCIDALVEDEPAFRRSLDAIVASLDDLAAGLADVCTERSTERYEDAVSTLETALDADASVPALVEAHDTVCQCASSLSVRVDVVPE